MPRALRQACNHAAQSRRVLYKLGLTLSETISAVAQELGHAFYGVFPTDDPIPDTRQEKRADRWATGAIVR